MAGVVRNFSIGLCAATVLGMVGLVGVTSTADAQITSTTTLTASPSHSVAGQPVILTATIHPTSPASVSGTVTFKSGAAIVATKAVSGTTTVVVLSTLPVGTLSLTASYGGSATVGASVSAHIAETVAKAATGVLLTTTSLHPAAHQSVTLSAQVSARAPSVETPTGAVSFSSGSATLGTATLVNGVAKLTTTKLPAGPIAVHAAYPGSARMLSATATAAKLGSSTLMQSNSAELGAPLSLVAIVSSIGLALGPAPTGTVVFTEAGNFVASAPLVPVGGGQSESHALTTVSTLSLGPHRLVATYSGGGSFAPSASPLSPVTVTRATVTVTVTSSGSPSTLGDPVTFYVTVAPTLPGNPTPTGTVDLFDGGTFLAGPITLSSGVGPVEVGSLAFGAHVLTASYAGDSNNLTGASSVPFTQQVDYPGRLLYSWGNNAEGETGHGDTTPWAAPASVGVSAEWASVNEGVTSSFGIKRDGTLWAWGDNTYGQLGTGDTTSHTSPVQVGTDSNWASVSAGYRDTYAIKADGTLWSWGQNLVGEVGDSTTTQRLAPVQIGVGHIWRQVTGGSYYHAVAVATNGTLWAWGYGGQGQLGNGSTANKTVPTQVDAGDLGAVWSSASAGGNSSAARRVDGTLWTWGDNSSGQLGTGDASAHTTPVQVGTDADWQSVSVGGDDMAAIKTNGSLWTWGANSFGQLATGGTIGSWSPVQVGTGGTWSSVDLRADSRLYALDTSGLLWAAGYNADGELGDGTTAQRDVLTVIGGTQQFTAVSAGGLDTLSLAAGA